MYTVFTLIAPPYNNTDMKSKLNIFSILSKKGWGKYLVINSAATSVHSWFAPQSASTEHSLVRGLKSPSKSASASSVKAGMDVPGHHLAAINTLGEEPRKKLLNTLIRADTKPSVAHVL